jgi:hypothetical protein
MIPDISIPVQSIDSDYEGFAQISYLFAKLKEKQFSHIKLDMSDMTWCDGNMCAALGAILYSVGRNPNEVRLSSMPDDVETILRKNGFLTNYGRYKKEDTYGSTIQYQRFERKDDRVFNYYIDEQFRNKAIPDMSKELYKKFLEALMEIFSNATIHSQTRLGIFVCGQYYHRKQKLDFTIADLGIGIRRNLSEKIGLDLPAEKAIAWAMEGANTTKRGPIPGGLGLKLLREFIKLNNGCLQVVSDRGYWIQNYDSQIEMKSMTNPFPGTVINLEINTADTCSYALTSELDEEIPF